jgi:iron complex outermembrane receptor protein
MLTGKDMSRSRILGTTGIALVMVSALGLAGAASAQSESASAAPGGAQPGKPAPGNPANATAGVAEVVVTARGRSEKLVQTPVSVQAFSGEMLAEDKITGLETLQTEAGFTFNSQGASFFGGGREFPTLVFRGMTSNYGAGLADSGALFVDGIFISGGAASVTMADVTQVEVLKGPQNVYFGKNTFGGAINLITANPTEAFHASASAGYSDKGSYDDVGTVEGALVPGLLTARVTGELFHQGAQYHDANGNPLGEQDTKGVTVVLYATPTPDIWFKNRFHYSADHDSQAADAYIGAPYQGTACPGMTNIYLCNGIPSLGQVGDSVLGSAAVPQTFINDVASGYPNGSAGARVNLLSKVPGEDSPGLVRESLQDSLQGGINNLPLNSSFQYSAGYNQQRSLDITSSDHTPSPEFQTALPFITRDFQADGRILTNPIGPLHIVAGLSYFRSTYLEQYSSWFFGGPGGINAPINEKNETEAAYGSVDYDIFSYLTATAEVRYQRDTVTDGPLDGATSPPYPVSSSYNHALPRFILKFHPNADTNVYLSYSEGVQPPQLQLSYVTDPAAPNGVNYTQEYLHALNGGTAYTKDPKIRVWEIGLKHNMFDDRVTFSVDYYNQFWDNALVEEYLFNPTGEGCSQTINYGASATCPLPGQGAGTFFVSQNHIQGIEFDGRARITSKLSAHLSFDWTDAIRKSYDDQSYGAAFTSGVVPSQDGKRIDLVPEYQLSADATYKDHLVADYDWYVHGVINYTGSQYADPTDIAELSGFVRVNVFAGITRGNVTFEAFCTNLFNNKDWNSAVRFPDPYAPNYFSEGAQGVIAAAPNPRDFGFKISAKF